jgi:dienelactone hydrolase
MVHVLAVEYPGYGVYAGSPDSNQIIEDVDNIYNYLIRDLHVSSKDILLYGRSIGSGPACWLAANKNPGALLLMSPYTSLRAVVRNLVGRVV